MTTSFRFADWPLRAKMAALLVATALLPLAIWTYIDLRQDQARLLERQEPPRGPWRPDRARARQLQSRLPALGRQDGPTSRLRGLLQRRR